MFNEILSKIKPTEKEEEEVRKVVNEFLKALNYKLKGAKAIIGGSFAKDTWLKGQHDIDIFVLFNNNNKKMSDKLEKAVKLCFKKYEKIHGSRDYFIVDYKGLSFELVPVLKIKNPIKAENITDISPMHVGWVKKNTNKKLVDDIRLVKQFMKASGCYGAETYIGGFSGYLVELLVIYYNGFNNLIKKAAKWKFGEKIILGKNNNFTSQQKFPLVVIDPVQPNRNAAAALRKEKFDLFIEICKKFIIKESIGYFEESRVNLKKYDIVFKVTPLKGSKDVVGTKMLKAFEYINNELENYGFEIKETGWFWNNFGYFYFKVKNKKLDKFRKHYGPPVKFNNDVEDFKKKYSKNKVKVEKDRVYVMLSRKFTKIEDFAKYIVKNKDVKDKVQNISIL